MSTPAAESPVPQAQAPQGSRWPAIVLWGLVAILGAATLWPLGSHIGAYLSFPFSLDETEGYLLGQVERLHTGGRLYGDIQQFPFVVDNYPPAWPVLCNAIETFVGAGWETGPLLPDASASSDDPRSVGVKAATYAHRMPLFRWLAFGCFVGLGWALAASWRRAGARVPTVALGLLLLVAQPPVFFLIPLARADWGALLLSVLALVLAERGIHSDDRKARRALWWALLPAIGAVLFRQSAIAPLAAIALTLFLQRDPRLWKWCLALVVSLGVVALTLHYTYGPGIWLHLTTYTRTRFLLERVGVTWGFLALHSSLFLVLAGVGWWTLRQKAGWTLPVVYAPLALATGLLSGKVGSDLNYFLEPLIGATWVLGYALITWMSSPPEATDAAAPPVVPARPVPAWIGIAVIAVLLQSAVLQNPRAGSYHPTRFDRANATELLNYLQDMDGPVLSEEEGIIALAGKPVWYNGFIMSELEHEGLFDDAIPVQLLDTKQVLVIITLRLPDPEAAIDSGTGAGWRRWTPAMQRSMAANYKPVMVVPYRREWIIMVPKR